MRDPQLGSIPAAGAIDIVVLHVAAPHLPAFLAAHIAPCLLSIDVPLPLPPGP
ncbi:hypothetical protein [Methylobacterium planeticum]|uniref:hypothetical protein n=1 Tax=Methylobacterium planeticum TaxID=2615211 RepID=UPI00177DB950|nr:hypothetical protein [Methylobacterium planeticum]